MKISIKDEFFIVWIPESLAKNFGEMHGALIDVAGFVSLVILSFSHIDRLDYVKDDGRFHSRVSLDSRRSSSIN